MTFQEKYVEQRKNAQKALKETQEQIDLEACADVVFKAIYEELDKMVKREYNVDVIKESKPISLEDEFRVRGAFYPTFVEVKRNNIDLGCNISTRTEEFEKLITKKLHEVGVDFVPDVKGGINFLAILKFEDSHDS